MRIEIMNETQVNDSLNKKEAFPKWLLSLFQRPFPVMDNGGMRSLVIVFHGLFIALFLLFFRPFEDIFITNSFLINIGFGVVVSLVLAFNHFVVAKLLPIDLTRWTIGKSIIWTLYDILTVIIGVFIYKNYWTGFTSFTWLDLWHIAYAALILAVIPVIISTIVLENWLLRRNLSKASKLRTFVNNKTDASLSSTNVNEELLLLYAENNSEWLKIHPKNLILIENADNYVTIYFKEKEQLSKKLLRSSLIKIEEQINASFILRCHRSYMVNLNKIKYVDGNSRGLQLQLLDMDKIVPVSRKYVKTIQEQLDELSA